MTQSKTPLTPLIEKTEKEIEILSDKMGDAEIEAEETSDVKTINFNLNIMSECGRKIKGLKATLSALRTAEQLWIKKTEELRGKVIAKHGAVDYVLNGDKIVDLINEIMGGENA